MGGDSGEGGAGVAETPEEGDPGGAVEGGGPSPRRSLAHRYQPEDTPRCSCFCGAIWVSPQGHSCSEGTSRLQPLCRPF